MNLTTPNSIELHVVTNATSSGLPYGASLNDYEMWEKMIIRFYMGMLAFIGNFANGIVLYLFFSTRTLRTPMNTLFISLTVSDFTVSFFATIPAWIQSVLWIKMAPTMCIIYGFLAFLGGTANANALMCIALERYLTVAKPFGIGSLTKARASIHLAFTWIMSFIVAASPIVGFSAYVGEGPGLWCSVLWEDDTLSGDAYIYFIFIASYFFPIAVIVLSYLKVILKIKEVAKMSMSESSVKAEKAVIRQSVVMVTSFVVAWSPYAVVCLIASLVEDNPFSPKAALPLAMFAKSSTIWNSFIYIGMNKQFRQVFIAKILKGKDPFAKKDKVEADASLGNTTYADKTAATAPGGNGNKVAPAGS